MRRDFATGLCFLAISGFFLFYGLQLPLGKASRMGPGYLPVAGAVLLGGLALTLLWQDYRARSSRKVGAIQWRELGLITASVLFFALSLNRLGLIAACFGAVLIAVAAERPFRLAEALALGAFLAAAATAIFVYGIGMMIPVWPDL